MTYSNVHPDATGVAVLEQAERLDAAEASLKKFGGGVGGGDNFEDTDREHDVANPHRHKKQETISTHLRTRANFPLVFFLARTVTTTVCHRR